MENPFTHAGQAGTDYVSSEADAAGAEVTNAGAVPTHLALILIAAGAGLWALKRVGFRFVATAGAKGGVS